MLDEAALAESFGANIDAVFSQTVHRTFENVETYHGLGKVINVFAVLGVGLKLQFAVGFDVLHVGRRNLKHRFGDVVALPLPQGNRHAKQHHGKPDHDADAVVLSETQKWLDADPGKIFYFHEPVDAV